MDFLGSTAVALLLLAAIRILKSKGRIWQALPLLLVVGLVLSPNPPGSSWVVWGALGLVSAVGVGLIGALCMRLGWAILPGLVAAPTFLEQIEVVFLRPFPGSLFGAVLCMALVAVALSYWTRALQEPGSVPEVGATGTGS